jgi:hypothetical protein
MSENHPEKIPMPLIRRVMPTIIADDLPQGVAPMTGPHFSIAAVSKVEQLPTPEEAAQSYQRDRYAQAVARFENDYGHPPGPFDIEICAGFDCHRSGFSWTVF